MVRGLVSQGRTKSARDQLAKVLQDLGFGIRQSDRAVRTVLNCWIRALWRGEVVEIPGGKIYTVPAKPGRRLIRTSSGYFLSRSYSKKIKFVPDKDEDPC